MPELALSQQSKKERENAFSKQLNLFQFVSFDPVSSHFLSPVILANDVQFTRPFLAKLQPPFRSFFLFLRN